MISDATKRQNRASRPESSTWVSANAGSGKTRVLTDRVARLLLVGHKPQKILCLTYTKAAAAEMQNRLFDRLGKWAMMDDAGLREALTSIGENGDNYNDDALKFTRTHFARALETPGGLKIQTIHAFCASLLRRFPVEAGVSPQFREMEEGQAALLRAKILDQMAREEQPDAFDALARHLTNEDALDRLLMDVLKNKEHFAAFDRDVLAVKLGISSDTTEQQICDTALSDLQTDLSQALVEYLSASEISAETKAGVAIAEARKLSAKPALEALESAFLIGGKNTAKTPRKSGLPSAKTKKNYAAFAESLERIKDAVFEARQQVLAVRALNRAQDLSRFAHDFINTYETAKAAQNLLDFDDLIDRTRALLSTREMTAWVLYRIDNGIDHILVDEAQDTSPNQWDIVESLSEEFTAGQGASEINRTLFVVGDKKQSIFGFQGADPEEFQTKQAIFGERFAQIGKTLETIEMPTSFRSAPPILQLVDQVFADDKVALGGPPEHQALDTTPGRVDLWAFDAPEDKPERPAWWEPVDTVVKSNPVLKLATKTAQFISDQIQNATPLHTKDGSRPVKPGDFLILVRSRTRFFHVLIETLKTLGVPVAGADRMKIGEQLAVRDLVSLLKFLDNELDDLSLAETLRSPIFGLSQNDLHTIAYNRKGSLWQSLRASAFKTAIAILNDLRTQSDFIRPYELLNRVLTKHGARLNLKARLGAECEDAIDELLAQAIAFEALETPTLGRFLFWLSAREIEIKRDMEAGQNEVRVMTVHGAKGLEAPIVILPDTSAEKAGQKKPPIGQIDGQVFWAQSKENEPQILLDQDEARKERDSYEYARLLYVALTRAENWLIVAGAGQENNDAHRWYKRVETAMNALGAADIDGTLSISHGWAGEVETTPRQPDQTTTLEPWLSETPKPLPPNPKTVSPSKFDGPHALPGDYIEDGTKRGDVIHQLLELLPLQPQDKWPSLTAQICGEDFDANDILNELRAVITKPELQDVFAPDTLIEVPITAKLDELDGRIINGRIDRLLVSPTKITAVDFKSNLVVPSKTTEIPKAILAQQGAYAAALSQIYPDRTIETAIIWTKTATMMSLPHADVIKALMSVTPS